MKITHFSVLKDEVIALLSSRFQAEDKISGIDFTLGEGGHSQAILSYFKNANLLGVDCDINIMNKAFLRLAEFGDRVKYKNVFFDEFLSEFDGNIDFGIFDFGVSMFHFKESGRGFTFLKEEPLDMRLSMEGESAYDFVNDRDENEITKILLEYGEEHLAPKIAAEIVKERKVKPIKSTLDLDRIVRNCYSRKMGRNNVSTKTFQAIRIFINDEIKRIERALPLAKDALNEGGILICITFHSLEDRVVKNTFNKFSNQSQKSIINKRVITPSWTEVSKNRASRSGKLRFFIK